jgi:hypothetical protein
VGVAEAAPPPRGYGLVIVLALVPVDEDADPEEDDADSTGLDRPVSAYLALRDDVTAKAAPPLAWTLRFALKLAAFQALRRVRRFP